MCPCYSGSTHYPTKEKPHAQNITVIENQVKQCKLSDHWKSIKMLFLKKNNSGWCKKDKRLTEIQVLRKYFTSYKTDVSL